MYLMIKHLHMTLAIVSILGFIVRGALAINQHTIMQQKWIRILPHIIDTGLLVAAIYLAWFLRLNPIQQPWLAAKIVALVVYIALGARVIKGRGSVRTQWITYAAAILTFAYIGAVAITRSVWVF